MASCLRSFRSIGRLSLFNVKNKHISLARVDRFLHKSYVLNDTTKIVMPALSPTMSEGTIVKWYKKEGETVSPGDILCDIQTDKAVMSFEMEEEGVLAKILKPEDTKNIQIGTLIALMVEEGDDWKNVTVPAEAGAPADVEIPTSSPPTLTSSPGKTGSDEMYGPAVRLLLESYHVNPASLPHTGPHKNLLKSDVLTYIKEKNLKPIIDAVPLPKSAVRPLQPATAPAVPAITTLPSVTVAGSGEYVDIDLTSMRTTIARRLTESKTTIPHHNATIDCPMDKLLDLRKKLIEDGVKVSVNDFIVKACAVALQSVPEVNAVWTGDAPRLLENIDICVAVATDSGLITPIVTDAIGSGVEEISTKTKDLAKRARSGKLQLHEFQGGSFTISNLGMFGITEFTAVINPPQASILAVGSSRIELDSEAKPRTLMAVTLCSDSRIVDEHTACKFLETLRSLIAEPMLLLSHRPAFDKDKLFAK